MDDELTEAEFWLLLSMDAESRLFELLLPVSQHRDGETRRLRPPLDISAAVEALSALVATGLVELRVMGGADEPDGWHRIPGDQVQAIIHDPPNWRVPSEATGTYWAAATFDGEAAYRRASEARNGAWIE